MPRRLFLIHALAAAVLLPIGAPAQDRVVPHSAEALRMSYAPIVKRVTPAVVTVSAAKTVANRNPLFEDPFFRRFFGPQFGGPRDQVQRSLGSGVIVDASGLVVTNNHVIEGADQVKISLTDRREFPVEIVLKDPRTDLAVMRVTNGGERFPALEMGNSDELQVGDVVLAVGNPFGVGQTVTHGIVSALARTQVGVTDYQFFIQTDAAINPGNSGGALADMAGRVVGNDPETDIAVLRVTAENLPAINFGSSDALRVGDVVLAIGNPFGVGQTVTGGIVSALGRTGLGINTFENFIQTDAAINPGNSGGALIDAAGNLVGINTAIFSRSGGSLGIGFAIPESTAKMVLDQIVKTGSVTRGWIGVEVQEITPAVAESFKLGSTRGALVAGVLRGGPADKAGVKPGDVMVEVDGKPVADPAAMLNLVAALGPGTTARVKVRRQNKEVDATIAVGRRPKPQARTE